MALLQNFVLRAQLVGRYTGASATATDGGNMRSQLGIRAQTMMAPFVSEAGWAATASLPEGYEFGNGWMPAKSNGAAWQANIGSASAASAFSLGTLNLAAGRNIDGSTSLAFTLPSAPLQLIVSAEGSTSITFTLPAAPLAGALYGEGSSAIAFSVSTATLGAIVQALGTAGVTFVAGATARAIGAMEGNITPFTELSPQSLATAVWGAVAASNDATGSMGEKLNDAGSASNPWTEVIESGYTAAEVLRLVASAAVGLASGGPGSPVFRDLGDTKDRIVGTADSDGNRTAVTYDPT